MANCASSVVCAVRSLTPGFARAEDDEADRAAGSASQFRPLDDGVTSVAFASATITAGVCDGSVLAGAGKAFGIHADDRHRDIVES